MTSDVGEGPTLRAHETLRCTSGRNGVPTPGAKKPRGGEQAVLAYGIGELP